jgi:hypothetical protein
MPEGFRTFGGAGASEITASTRFTRILRVIDAASSGSMVVPELAEGTPFMFSRPESSGVNIFSGGSVGTISGTTVSWTGRANFLLGIY